LTPISLRLVLLFACACALSPFRAPASAQSQCETVSSIQFPFETSAFTLVQDFGVPSVRHQGRYHVGEDWYGGRGSSLGSPVRAVASGRVTFSSNNGWGRDGGVIIIEHNFPDGSTAYSQYGHLQEAAGVPFPAVLACVSAGDVIAAVGDARPAPHVHFEIRTNSPDIPGPGYTYDFPTGLGWRRPSKFILNWQTWLSEAHTWHLDLADEAGPVTPPLARPDDSLIFLDADRVSRVSNDGRVLWRINLDRPAVALIDNPSPTVIFADGSTRAIDDDGNPGISGAFGAAVQGAAMTFANGAPSVFHTPDNALIAVDPTISGILWRIDDIPAVVRHAATADRLAVVTQTNEVLIIAVDGALIDRAQLRAPAALYGHGDDLLAYTQGGFWRVDAAGAWTLLIPDAPPGGANAAITADALTGDLTLFDGFTLRAYDAAYNPRWSVDLPGVGGDVTLTHVGDVLLLTSTFGNLAAIRAADGAVCNTARLFGDRRARAWSALGDDGVLRLYVADQIAAFDWRTFLLGCG
jgi:murein DD-endopeptidase MepM/ murein hydrolase activator NlpD